jgi:2-polyprenyl-3-methyl-5-hydroxy-6-metoxy-1,4-benzoquinol methylase
MTMSRSESFGQGHGLSPVDRFGIWLSHRQISRWADLRGKRIADLGCGFEARLVRAALDEVQHATLVDVSLAPELKAHPKVTAVEGHLPEALAGVPSGSLDVVLCISVLEHLEKPREMLAEIYRILAPGATALVNVPSWRGKKFLELSAFRLGLSPAAEMDDHKMYYDVRDLWPLLVEAGFKPSGLRCWAHKFGLNTFAVCEKQVP